MSGKKIIILLAAAAAIIAAALFGGAWYFSTLLMYPKSPCDPAYHVYCGDPSELKLPFENVSFTTDDGVRLSGWFIPAPGSRKAVVFVHGHGGIMQEGLRYATALHGAGFSLLMFNQRLHSGSDKSYVSMGYYEKTDVKAAVDYLVNSRKAGTVGLMGFSLGASTGILAMAQDKRIQAGLFNSGYANVADLLADVAKRDYGLPRFPMIPLVMWIASLRGNFDLNAINAEEYIGSIAPRPVFIVQCTGDDYVPHRHGERIYAAAGMPKESWFPPCTRHVQDWNQFRAESEKRVSGFFTKNLKD